MTTYTEYHDDEPAKKPTPKQRWREFTDLLWSLCILIGVFGGFIYYVEIAIEFIKSLIKAL